jgi:imidazolonepropionase-like amidohydrolase
VAAGVTTIEHGTYMSEATLVMMAERGTYLVPTMAIVRDLTIPGGDYDNAVLRLRGEHMLPRMHEMVANAYALGVKIVASTDTGYGPNSTVRIAHELEDLVSIGMTPLEALQAATLTTAELFGVEDHTGRIAVGLDADLIVTERNPLENVSVMHDVLLVVNNGRVSLAKGDQFEAGPRPVS